MDLDEEWMVNFCENIALGHHTLVLLFLLDVFLFHRLKRVELTVATLSD